MFYFVILFAVGTFALGEAAVPFWMEFNSIERRVSSTPWWENYTATTTEAWWNNFTKTKTPLEPLPAEDLVLSPRDALELIDDADKLNQTISEQTEKMFGEDTPELHELVTMWFFMLVNRTRVLQVSRYTPDRYKYTSSTPASTTRRVTQPTRRPTNPTSSPARPLDEAEEVMATTVTEPLHLTTGQAGLSTGQVDVGELDYIGTVQEDLGTGLDIISIGANLGTEPADIGTVQVDFTGPNYVSIEPSASTGQEHPDTGHGDPDTGQEHPDTGPAHFGSEPVDLGTEPPELYTGPNDVTTGPAAKSTGPANVHEITIAMDSIGTPDTDIDDTTVKKDFSKREPSYPFLEHNSLPEKQDLRYIGGRGKPPPKQAWFPRPALYYTYKYNGLLRQLTPGPPQMTPGSQQQPSSERPAPQGVPTEFKGITGWPKDLPVTVTPQTTGHSPDPGVNTSNFLQKDLPVTVTPQTTGHNPDHVTEATSFQALIKKVVPPEYRDMLAWPDYAAMAGYIGAGAGRPNLVNEAEDIKVLYGAVSSSTSTENPLVESLKRDMVATSDGFFSTFLKKLLQIVATMDLEKAGYLFVATDMIVNDLERTGWMRFLGMPLQPVIIRATTVLAGTPPEIAQSRAVLAYKFISNRKVLPPELNDVLNMMDSLYHANEGEALFASLVVLQSYPENNFTSRQVMEKVIIALSNPLQRMKGTQQLNTVISKLNIILEKRFPLRRYLERAQRGLTSHLSFRERTKNHWTVQTYTDRHKRKGLTTKKNMYRHELAGKLYRGPTNKIHAIDSMKHKMKRLKIRGMSIETDGYHRLDKPKHETHTKKSVKSIIKDHLKNKHPELYKNYRHKYKKAKEQNKKANEAMFGRVFQNRYREDFSSTIDRGIDTQKEMSQSETSEKPRNRPQTRFNIVDPEFEIENGGNIHKKILNADKTKPKIESKYLAKYKLKTKPHKQIITKNRPNLLGEDSISNDDEKELKFNLQDTLRHGHRNFPGRRNFRTRNKNVIQQLSSYSDEEGTLKNNIYKVFGYTAHH